jgi:hypothetical protein
MAIPDVALSLDLGILITGIIAKSTVTVFNARVARRMSLRNGIGGLIKF